MSIKVMTWVWENSPAKGIERLVLLAIADNADDQGDNAWPSILTLAKKCRIDERTVQRAIRKLVMAGHLTVAQNAGQCGSNRYKVATNHLGQDATPGTVPPTSSPAKSQWSDGTTPPRQPAPPAESPSGGGTAPHEPSLNHPSELPNGSSNTLAIHRDDIEAICLHLADRIQENGSRRPTITAKWRTAARLLLDRDGKTPEQIHRAIDWSQSHEFWRGAVLSMPKLRQQYDQMAQQAKRPNGPRAVVSTTDQRVLAAREMQLKQQAEEATRAQI